MSPLVPILGIIWLSIAHLEFPSLEIFWGMTAHPGFCAKTGLYYDKKAILVLYLVNWVGNDELLPTQNIKSKVGKLKRGQSTKKLVLSHQFLSCPPYSENVPVPMP